MQIQIKLRLIWIDIGNQTTRHWSSKYLKFVDLNENKIMKNILMRRIENNNKLHI